MIRDAERKLFAAFQACQPNFAGRSVKCQEGWDPPDFICEDSNGIRIGVELAEWVTGAQIAASKAKHEIRQSYSKAVSSPSVSPSNIGRVWLHPANALPPAEESDFRRQLFDFVMAVDSNWVNVSQRGNPSQGIPIRDFSGFALLKAHVLQLDLFPKGDASFSIALLNGGGAYSPRSALGALLSVLGKKTGMYAGLHQKQNLAELYLVIYWWQGYIHNSPYDAPGYGLSEVGAELSPIVQGNPGQFQRIYLFDYAKNVVVPV